MAYNHNARRPNLSDGTTAAIVKAQVLTNPVLDPMAPTDPRIDTGKALLHELPENMQVLNNCQHDRAWCPHPRQFLTIDTGKQNLPPRNTFLQCL